MLSREFERLTRRLRKPTGQITGDDGLAAWLRAIAADPNVYLFMEIGAWEGNGSTRILREAAESRASLNVLSLEANESRARRAQNRNASTNQVQVLWGSLVGEDQLDVNNLTDEERSWLDQDLSAIRKCPKVLEFVPNKVDALFLDGGEFSTHAEYLCLSARITKWLVLDDTNTRKSRAVAQEIRRGSTPFTPIIDSSDRNGFMVAFRK